MVTEANKNGTSLFIVEYIEKYCLTKMRDDFKVQV